MNDSEIKSKPIIVYNLEEYRENLGIRRSDWVIERRKWGKYWDRSRLGREGWKKR